MRLSLWSRPEFAHVDVLSRSVDAEAAATSYKNSNRGPLTPNAEAERGKTKESQRQELHTSVLKPPSLKPDVAHHNCEVVDD